MNQEIDIDEYIKEGRMHLDEALVHLNNELSKIRAGKASVSMLNGIMVEYYGNPTPLNQVASISAVDSRTLSIQPWEKNMLAPIERAIFEANLGITPMNDGEFVRISIPPLTEERRIQLVKQCKGLGEDSKVSIRTTRHKVLDFIKSEVKNGYPEDAGKRLEHKVEDMVKEYNEKVDKILVAKEQDIMKV